MKTCPSVIKKLEVLMKENAYVDLLKVGKKILISYNAITAVFFNMPEHWLSICVLHLQSKFALKRRGIVLPKRASETTRY